MPQVSIELGGVYSGYWQYNGPRPFTSRKRKVRVTSITSRDKAGAPEHFETVTMKDDGTETNTPQHWHADPFQQWVKQVVSLPLRPAPAADK